MTKGAGTGMSNSSRLIENLGTVAPRSRRGGEAEQRQ